MSAPTRRRGAPGVTEDQLAWLRGGSGGAWETDWRFFGDGPEPAPAQLWAAHRDWVLAEYATEHPGTRPERWWVFDAPEPRRRVGGVGTPMRPRLGGGSPALHLGVPDEWITEAELRTYALMSSPLDVPALDPADPPRYESEAAYLERLGLLLPGERRRLSPDDFEPVSIFEIIDFSSGDDKGA